MPSGAARLIQKAGHKYGNLSSFLRAGVTTFSRISEAVAVRMKGLGLSLWLRHRLALDFPVVSGDGDCALFGP